MKLDFSVPEIFLSDIKIGTEIKANARAYPMELFIGRISSIDSRIDPDTRSISIRAILSNENKKLKPGMLMRVALMSNVRKSIVIPEEAVIHKNDKQFV